MTPSTVEARPTKRSGPWLWHGVFWLAALGASMAIFAGMQQLARSLYPETVRWLGDRADVFDNSLQRIGLARLAGFDPAVVYFGDSTVSDYDESNDSLHRLTLVMLRRRHGHHRTFMASLAGAGSGVDQYSFYADRIAEAEPDLVIWQLSFFQFTDRWTNANGAPELVGYVDAERLPEILTLPYERLHLSLADILLQQGIVRLGLHDLHRAVRKSQLRFAHLRELLEEALNPNRGRSPEKRAKTIRGVEFFRRHIDQELHDRYTILGERSHFATTLGGLDPGDVRLGLLRSGLSALQQHDIDVLVYLNPTNLDHLRNLGIYDEEGLGRTLDEIRQVVEQGGATFLDLHELLNDEDFADPSGHFAVDENGTVPKRVATEVARAAHEMLLDRAALGPARLRNPAGSTLPARDGGDDSVEHDVEQEGTP